MSRLLVLLLLLIATPAWGQLIPYPSTSPLYSQPSTADPGELRLPEAATNGTNYTAIKAPASIAADVTFTWPGALPTTTGCFTSNTAGILTIEECNFSLSATNDWTGATTYATSGGLGLKPHGTSAGNTTELRLLELATNGTNYVGIKAPDAITTSLIWTLPSADSSGCLQSNGSGTLSLSSCAPATASFVVVGAHADLTVERVLTAGTGISLTDAGAGSTMTVANTGVTSNVAGTGISVSGATGAVTVTNSGVTSLTGTTNQVVVSVATGAVTLSLPQSIATASTPTFGGLTSPSLVGGAGVGSSLTLQSTSGVGSSDFIRFLVGNNGATEVARITTTGLFGIGTPTPVYKLDVQVAVGMNLGVRQGLYDNPGVALQSSDDANNTIPMEFIGTSWRFAKIDGLTTLMTIGNTGNVAAAGTYSASSQAAFKLNPYGTSAGNTGEIRFLELAAGGTSYVGFKAADALAGNVIWTLPSADASGCLQSNGSGVLSLSACPGAGGGVAVGDSPTWTGQHTFTSASIGPKVMLSDIDSQLFVGGTTDPGPGWTVPAVHLRAQGVVYSEAVGNMNIGRNVYWDGAAKYIVTAASENLLINGTGFQFLTASSGTAGTAITYTTEALISGGMTLGSPTGSVKGVGTLNSAGAYYINGTVGCSGVPSTATSGLATTCTSDDRLKTVAGTFTTGLAAIQQLRPIRFRWNDRQPSEDPWVERVGFSAQNVQRAIPEAVWPVRQPDGQTWLTLSDRVILATSVNAIQELARRVSALEAR